MINIRIGNNTFIIRKVYIAAEYATIDWVWEKRPAGSADGEDDGNSKFSRTVGFNIVAFSSEPVNGKHLAVWLVLFASGSESRNSSGGYFKVPRAPKLKTTEVATFKNA